MTDGCDFRRNVDCDGKDETEEEDEQPSSTTSRTTAAKPKKPGEPETLEDVLEAIKDAGLTYLLIIYLAYSGFFLYDFRKKNLKRKKGFSKKWQNTVAPPCFPPFLGHNIGIEIVHCPWYLYIVHT